VTFPTPRLPVLDWNTYSGKKLSVAPCLLTLSTVQFTTSGRAAILLALEMLGVGPGDKVLVPTYHCPTMIAPIIACGAQAVFYPLNELGAPQLEWIKQADLQGVRAILVAHFFGLPQRLETIRLWCDFQGVSLIEDCAHSLFGSSDGRPVGRWGDLAIASLTKFFPVPEGGCLVVNTTQSAIPKLNQPSAIRQVKAGIDIIHSGVNHGRLNGFGVLVKGAFKILDRFRAKKPLQHPSSELQPSDGFTIDVAQSHQALTVACRWTAQHAPRERIVARRREHYMFLAQALSGLNGMRPLRVHLPDDCAPYVFPLWVDHADPGYAELRRLEFPVSRWDRLWPTAPAIEIDSGMLWSVHVLQLACHQDLSFGELQNMVDTLKRVYPVNILESRPQQTMANPRIGMVGKASTKGPA
jgi:perosamine synthetase